MSRAQRLLALIQILRRHRFAVTGANLAEDLGISLRILIPRYRHITGTRPTMINAWRRQFMEHAVISDHDMNVIAVAMGADFVR